MVQKLTTSRLIRAEEDTDGGTVDDGVEVKRGTDPLKLMTT